MTSSVPAKTDWLALREPVDAAARAVGPVRRLSSLLPTERPLVIRDLGCGTGSMGRWLAPLLPGPQHWVAQDIDPETLTRVRSRMRGVTAQDGHRVTVETRHDDLRTISGDHLTTTSLVVASALLDLLTAVEVERVAAACTAAGCPALCTLSVTGVVDMAPPDPWDAAIATAFNAHQRRHVAAQPLLGPAAVTAAHRSFRRRGATSCGWPSTWHLDATRPELTEQWLRERVRVARDWHPDLAVEAAHYLRRRLAQLRAGELVARVWHEDLLAIPGGSVR